MLTTILMVFAFVFFVLGAVGVPEHPRFHYVSAGLACWSLTLLLSGFR